MKKFISLLLVFVLAISITACDSSKNEGSYNPETLPLDIEELKANWKEGELIFANGNAVTLPCSIDEFVETSGLTVRNADLINKVLSPDETYTLNLVGSETNISIKCKNTTEEDLDYADSTVIGYTITNMQTGNRKIKFAGTLTAGVVRADVEKALEIPKNKTSEDVMYTYSSRNSKNKKVELRITFNSDDIVNSVAFKVDT